ncbi:MAG: hypothetical protein DRH97_05305 [Chloroflexi bacterium]|nr:MAG: hypothetical protein DRH97_05305 [Chloroflexota bacterium]
MPIIKTLLDPLTQGKVPQGNRSTPGRYKKSWAYQDDDGRYFLGTFPAVTIPPHSSDSIYVLEAGDVARPDLIAYKFYKSPEYYWVILWVNGISDPFEEMFAGRTIRVPALRRLMEFGVKA